jgi:hypothetical protein
VAKECVLQESADRDAMEVGRDQRRTAWPALELEALADRHAILDGDVDSHEARQVPASPS